MLPDHRDVRALLLACGPVRATARATRPLHPDTMDQRYGAWAQLLVLFRMVHDGAEAGGVRLPPRHGVLFDPDRYPFLEGRSGAGARQVGERIEPPLVPDGDDLPRAGQAARPRRRADLLPRARRRADRLGLRDDDGLPTGTGRGPLDRGQGAEAAGARPRRSTSTRCSLSSPAKRAKWLQDRADRKLTAKRHRRCPRRCNASKTSTPPCCRQSTRPRRRT